VTATITAPARLSHWQMEAFLLRSLPWLLRQQLPTGELLCYRKEPGRDAVPYPYPLFSALASEALTCLDPRSPYFSPRLHDLIPASRRRACTRVIITIRWRIRYYLAAEEDAGGLWRLHGRSGSSAPDLATTACAAALLLEERHDAPARHVGAVRRLMAEQPGDALGWLFGLRLLSLAGEPDPVSLQAVGQLIANEIGDPIPVAWAMDQVEHDGHIVFGRAIRDRPPSAIPPAGSRLRMAFAVSSLLHRGHRGPELDRGIDALANDPAPPWLLEHDPLRHFVASPAATLAIILRTMAQALANEDAGRSTC
jgi:hypothetical protein